MNAQTFCELRNECYRKLFCSVMGMVKNRVVAEDITAAAFVTAFKKRDSFRGESSFYTWMYRIAVHEVIHWSRRNRRSVMESIDRPAAKELSEPDLLSQSIDRSQCCVKLRKVLRRIPTKYRRVLVDHFVRGYPTRRIAQEQNIPLGTVLSRIFKGKQTLREAWGVV